MIRHQSSNILRLLLLSMLPQLLDGGMRRFVVDATSASVDVDVAYHSLCSV